MSSDGLATALQDSASALMEGGNNLEQAVALVAAANRVVQDPSSVGSALRTISLRLRGTSVEVLEEMGEETDGVVESTSKLQEKLKALTGVDIVDMNGAYKDTYTILKEIGSVWKDLDPMDQAAALELMAGKNRANTLAAILNNMKDLEGAYNDALKAEGSALKENEAYLSSIQGRIDLFNNSLQTMWMNFINDDAVKFVVDLGTGLINLVNNLGLIKTVLLGVVTVLTGKMLIGNIKDIGTWLQILFTAKTTSDIPNVLEAIFKKTDLLKSALVQAGAAQAGLNATQLAGTSIVGLLKLGFTGLTTAVKGFLTSIGPVGWAIIGVTTAVTAGAAIFSKYHKTAEEVRQEVEELTESYKTAKKEFDDNLKGLESLSNTGELKDLESEFEKLSTGVNRNGENVSLTSDEYERYKSICEKIIGVNPSLAAGYDSATQAIGNNASALSQLIELQKEEARIRALEFTSDDNLDTIYKNAKNNYNDAINDKDDIEFSYDDAARVAEQIKSAISGQWNETGSQFTADALGISGILASLGLEELFTDDLAGYGTTTDALAQVIMNHSDEVIAALNAASDGTSVAFEDYSLTLNSDILGAASISLQGAANEYKGNVNAANKKIESANKGLIDTLSQLFVASSTYDDLNKSSKTFLNTWLMESDLFNIDSSLTIKEMKDKINDMIAYLSGSINAQDILDQIFKIDASGVNYNAYKKQISELIDQFWLAIGGENNQFGIKNKQELAIQFGFNFTFDRSHGPGQTDEGALVNDLVRVTGDSIKEVQDWLDNQPAAVVTALMNVDWSVESGLTYDQVLEKVQATIPDETISVNTYSALVSEIESYNEVLSQTSEIISDNTEVTQEYKDSLTDLGLSEEELADCFDDNNKLIVKNAALLNKLVAKKKQDKQATVQQAKAYGQLQYKNTINQIGQLVNRMATEIKATGLVSAATLDNISVLRKQLDVIKQTIQQYALLELSLSDAAQAYSDFEAAKERDAQLAYGDSMVEALNVLNEGFKTGQVGSEAFQYAVKLVVPPEVYENIDNVQERMQAIHDYVDKNPIFADYFTIDEGQISITMDNIKAFLQDGLDDGLGANFGTFIGTIEDFDLAPHIQSVKDLADAYGITEAAALAMLTEFEKYDASWGNIISRLTTTELDRNIEDTTTALEKAIAAQEKFIRDGNQLYDEHGNNTAEYQKIVDGVTNAYEALGVATKAAVDHATEYTQVEAILQGMTGELKLTQEQADNLARSLGIIGEGQSVTILDDGSIKLTQEQLDILNTKLKVLGENPTTLDIQLASDTIDQQIQELQKKLVGEEYDKEVLVDINVEGEDKIQQKIDELTAAQDVIELVYDITPSGDQNDSNLEKLGNWEANGVTIAVRADMTEFDTVTETINATEMPTKEVTITTTAEDANAEIQTVTDNNPPEKEVIIDTTAEDANAEIDTVTNNNPPDKEVNIAMQGVSTAISEINSIGNALAGLSGTTYHTVVVQYDNQNSGIYNADGNFHISGNAFAGGTVGAPKTETSLVGELGPELIVDPSTGRWHTVGDHGAEFTQVKKGQIIFNHLQTRQLLENGYVTSRGRLQGGGSAFASGTAYGFGIYDDYVGDNDAFANGSDKWVNPGENAWSDAADDLSDAADDIADDAEQIVDFIEMKLEEIEAIITKTTTSIANFLDDTTDIKSKDELYDELIKAEKDKSEAYLKAAQKYNVQAAAALSGVPQQYQAMARNGAIAIEEFLGEDQVEIAEKIQEYRDWAAKADEAENGHLEAIAAISAHRVEQLEDIATDFENIVSISKSHSDLLQAEMDFIEESGNRLSESYYEELKKHSQKQLDDMQAERAALQKILDDSVAAGDVVIGSDDWYSMLETIYEVDQEIVDCKTSLEEFQNAINELYWDNFDKLIEQLDTVDSELSNLYDLVSDAEDVVDEAGNWTADGYTALGLLVQQMEVAQQKSKEYGDAISKLKKDYKDGLYSTDEYNEKLAELTDGQYDAIKSYEDAKDAIIDLNKTRVDAVKEGIQKEIDAYEELISKKKESLDADKDARDFERSVEDSNKSISDVERKIASLKGNTSSSAIAERRRLEEELRKLQQERDDLFYDESVENQQEALDKELENFQDAKNKEIEDLEEYLKNQEKVLQDSFAIVQENTQQIAGKLVEIAEDYGVTISDTVATPWINGTNAIGKYQEQLNTSVSVTTKNLETLKQQLKDLETQADKTANSVINATHSTVVTANDGHQTSIKGYAKGSKSVEYDQWALIDELGDELQLVPNKAGRLDYIKKGTGILNNTLTEKLIDLAIDPTSMLENSRPVVGAPGITTTNNTFTIDASVGTLLHVEHLDGNNPTEVAKLVDKAWEKKMQILNNSIKKFTR